MNKRFVSILLAVVLTLALALPVMAGGANPITLQATCGSDYVSLSWTPVSNSSTFSGYYVYRSTQPGSSSGTPVHDFPQTTTNFTDSNIEKGIIYYYSVCPVYGSTIDSPSNEVQVRVGSLGITIIMQIANPVMLVNGVAQPIDPTSDLVAPILKNNRTFVPIRAVVEALGGTVSYDAGTRMVTVNLDNSTIKLWIDNKNIEVNGVTKVMDVAPYIESDRTYLPLRFVLENLNCTTEWNGETHQITINRVSLTGTGQVSGSAPSVPGNITPDGSGTITAAGSGNTGTGSTGASGGVVWDFEHPDINGPSVNGTLEPPATQLSNWTGSWDTSYGVLILTQSGNQVTGTYPDGALTGTASGSVLTGTFDEDGGYTGPFTFTMSSDGKSFTGTWHYYGNTEDMEWIGTRMTNTSGAAATGSGNTGTGGTGTSGGVVWDFEHPDINGPSVNGTLEPPPTLLNWTGSWDTSYGVLVLTQSVNQVAGTYPDGALTGTASGSVLTGTFDEGGGYTGPFTFTMSSDGRSFTGTWHYYGNTDDMEWIGTRMTD